MRFVRRPNGGNDDKPAIDRFTPADRRAFIEIVAELALARALAEEAHEAASTTEKADTAQGEGASS